MTTTDPEFPNVPDQALDADPESEGDDLFLDQGDGRFRIAFTTRSGRRVDFVTRRMRVGDLWDVQDGILDVQEAEAAEAEEVAAADAAAREAWRAKGLPPQVDGKGNVIPVTDRRKGVEVRRRREERVARFLLETALPRCSPKGALDGVELDDLPSWWPGILGPLNDGWRYLPTLPGTG